MKEKPILFSDRMVMAILGEKKTQTRRIVKPQPDEDGLSKVVGGPWVDTSALEYRAPGAAGDILWVRESFRLSSIIDHRKPSSAMPGSAVKYEADGSVYCRFNRARRELPFGDGKLRPSIFMPRWASRINLEIKGVRVERLQDISEGDARAEGAHCELRRLDSVLMGAKSSYRGGFENLWESIHGWDSWKPNPWVWVIEFKKVDRV